MKTSSPLLPLLHKTNITFINQHSAQTYKTVMKPLKFSYFFDKIWEFTHMYKSRTIGYKRKIFQISRTIIYILSSYLRVVLKLITVLIMGVIYKPFLVEFTTTPVLKKLHNVS